MSITKIQIEELSALKRTIPVLDVRSPIEYLHAHIPGALSFPLFTNDERKIIGTAYRHEGREKAVKIGLESFGRNMVKMVDAAEKIVRDKNTQGREVIVHCWRGGMRSGAVAWLLDLYGFKVHLLSGGYKSYRGWALKQFAKEYRLGVIGGYTGSNKTGIIHELKKAGDHVIDLEALAGHMGSAFGNLERIEQPSQEHFENLLATQLFEFYEKNPAKTIWLENESQRIGNINMPQPFFDYFSAQASYFINVPFEQRLKHIVALYGKSSKESLINAIVRITKKLGGLEAKTAVNFLMDDDISACFELLLKYYDKLYHKNELKRKLDNTSVVHIDCDTTDAQTNLQKISDHANRGG
ncbi:MAG: tRNA 2-selenouridine(34) synthase MnmH [Bacteroidota bacterium]